MQKSSSFIRFLRLLGLLSLLAACGSVKEQPLRHAEGELKDLYNDPYLVKVIENTIHIGPTNPQWSGYGHVNTEAEQVSFLVRAALVEANNVCPTNKRSKIIGKPRILKTGPDSKQRVTGAELNFTCKNR
jgi:hypothetical protein